MRAARLGFLLPLVAGVGAFLFFVYARDWPLALALLIGAAIMMLGWVAARTFERLRDMSRGR